MSAPAALAAAWAAWVLWCVAGPGRRRARRPPAVDGGRRAAARRARHRTAGLGLVAGAVALVAVGPAGPVVVGAVGFALAAARRRARARAAARRAAACVPDVAELVRIGVAGGLTPALALAAVAELGPEPGRAASGAVVAATARGRPLGDALGELVVGLGPPARALVDALAATDRYGVPLAPVLDAVVLDLRRQRRLDAQAAARRLPVTLSFPLVGCVLPAFALLTLAPLVAGALASLDVRPPAAVPLGRPGAP